MLLPPGGFATAWAQSDGAAKLLRTPKRALVIGNAAYRSDAVLRNPVNDAEAVTAALQAFGFEVTHRHDATREAMLAAIDAFTRELALGNTSARHHDVPLLKQLGDPAAAQLGPRHHQLVEALPCLACRHRECERSHQRP